MKNLISKILIAGSLLIPGCSRYSQYEYDGKIGEDQVRFGYSLLGEDNQLTVIKPDGREVLYCDRLNGDLKLESVEITKDGQTEIYNSNNEVGTPVVKEAQKQFDEYLQKIKETKIKEGLEGLR